MNRGDSFRVVLAVAVGALAALSSLSSCSKKRVPSSSTEPPPAAVVERQTPASPVEVKDWDSARGTASITGAVTFSGKAPRPQRIVMKADEECEALHTEGALDESVVVNRDGALGNVFVWVKRGLEGWRFPVPSEPVTLEQKGCVFVPHVLGVQVRQDVLIRNRDPLLHNVHSHSKRNFGFNFGQTVGKENRESFRRPEVMVTVKCDMHPWMSCHIGVLPHPFFAVTGDDGSFELKGLPPGDYTIEAWHEVYGAKTMNITVGDKETTKLQFGFEGA